MTDPMASKGVDRAVARVLTQIAAAAPATPVQPATSPARTPSGADAVALSGVAASLAARAPVDADRVQEIKRAIANGTFPILPATIADRLLALRYDWLSRDPE